MPLAFLLESSFAPLGVMILLIGVSFLAPLFYNVKGILYREIFGISLATNKPIDITLLTNSAKSDKNSSDSDDTFSA